MDKEIPISQEKNSRADRLRAASRRLEALPLERIPSDAEWDAATEALTRDDIEHLKRLATGYRDRALEGSLEGEELIEEAAASLLLWPKDAAWAAETMQSYRKAGWKGPDAEKFFALISKRLARKKTIPRWLIPFFVALIAIPLGIALSISLLNNLNRNSAVSSVQGPRNLEATFDTQGVKTNVQVAQSRLLIFPEATVAEFSAWVTFPEHRVDVWEGTVSVLDAQGDALVTRDVTFHASSGGPLQAGQGLEIFQQFDAWPFYDKVSSFQVRTTRILAQEAKPKDRKEMLVGGIEALTAGYQLKVWIQDSQWSNRFASKVQTMVFELENTGLKPFAELQFALVWRDLSGKTLKTLLFRPVSSFRTALPSGARLPWTQETVFDTEVFSWPQGEEPFPVLELRKWQ